MKAVFYTASRQLELRDAAEPSAKTGEAVVAVDAVGICGSDMHAWLGHDPRRVPPLILGHEIAGRAGGNGDSSGGARVAVNPLVTCGACAHCKNGRGNLCAKRELLGMRLPGGFAECVAVAEKNLLPVPPALSTVQAALCEPLAVCVHALARAAGAGGGAVDGGRALVIGGGAIGLLSALLLCSAGVEVCIAETNQLRRAVLEKADCGAVVAGATGQNQFSLVVDAVGSAATRAIAVRAAAGGGVVVHVGLADNDGGLDTRKMTLEEIAFIGVYAYTEADFAAALGKLAAGALGGLEWVETRPLADAPQTFAEIHAGKCAAPKVVLLP